MVVCREKGRGSGCQEAAGPQPPGAPCGPPPTPQRLRSMGCQLGLLLPTLIFPGARLPSSRELTWQGIPRSEPLGPATTLTVV